MKPKKPTPPTVLSSPDQMEGATKHKDHYHSAKGEKFYGNSNMTDKADLTGHKGHFHDSAGTKFYEGPGEGADAHNEPPTEDDVVEESVKEQRKILKRGKQKTSSINTVLQSSGTGTQGGHSLG